MSSQSNQKLRRHSCRFRQFSFKMKLNRRVRPLQPLSGNMVFEPPHALHRLFFYAMFLLFTFTASIGFAQDSVSVKIQEPTTEFVDGSFTVSGVAQAGAKLHVTINGKTFGRYRADIGGRFTIGISVPETNITIQIDHISNGKILSSDSITLKVGQEKAQTRVLEEDGETRGVVEKSNKEKGEKVQEKTIGIEEKTVKDIDVFKDELAPQQKTLPTSERIPPKPNALKNEFPNTSKNPRNPLTRAKPVDYEPLTRNEPIADRQTQRSSAGARLGAEALAAFAITGIMFLVTLSLLESNFSEELAFSLLLAEFALAPIGVYVGGNLMDGKGDLWAVYVGELFGIAGSVGLVILADEQSGAVKDGLFLLAFLTPFIGMIGGYEIQHARNSADLGWSMRIEPSIRINQDAQTVGLRFRF